MKLKAIIQDLEISSIRGQGDPLIGKITFDSREVHQGDLFVAVRGTQADGHDYLHKALSSGAAAVVCEEVPDTENGIPLICVPDSRKAPST